MFSLRLYTLCCIFLVLSFSSISITSNYTLKKMTKLISKGGGGDSGKGGANASPHLPNETLNIFPVYIQSLDSYLLGRIQAVCRPHLHQNCPRGHHTLYPILHYSTFQLDLLCGLIHQQAGVDHQYSLPAMPKDRSQDYSKIQCILKHYYVVHWKPKN